MKEKNSLGIFGNTTPGKKCTCFLGQESCLWDYFIPKDVHIGRNTVNSFLFKKVCGIFFAFKYWQDGVDGYLCKQIAFLQEYVFLRGEEYIDTTLREKNKLSFIPIPQNSNLGRKPYYLAFQVIFSDNRLLYFSHSVDALRYLLTLKYGQILKNISRYLNALGNKISFRNIILTFEQAIFGAYIRKKYAILQYVHSSGEIIDLLWMHCLEKVVINRTLLRSRYIFLKGIVTNIKNKKYSQKWKERTTFVFFKWILCCFVQILAFFHFMYKDYIKIGEWRMVIG